MGTTLETRTVERRNVPASFELREADNGIVGLVGYAAVFDQVAYGEVVRSGAFTKTLQEGDDVRLLVNHDGVPLARTKADTMRLTVDDKGLRVDVDELDVVGNPTAAELVSALTRGDIDQMSFAFTPVLEKDTETDDGEIIRELLEVRLWDVSVVTYPWYDDTSVGLNEWERALLEVRSGQLSAETREQIAAAVLTTTSESREDPGTEPEPVTLTADQARYYAAIEAAPPTPVA